MNDPELQIIIDLEDDSAVTAPELQLLADLLPELVKDLLWLRDNSEASIMAVALYARVSTTRQPDRDLSIPDQLRQMRDWCQRNGYSVGKEYLEPGASATDDKRPAFQQMIGDATTKPAPFEVVVVHILSRFVRDFLEFALYERRLNKAGVKVVSITQQTSEHTAGEMARRTHLLDVRRIPEQGELQAHAACDEGERTAGLLQCGSQPSFGFKNEELDLVAAKGKKKRLVIDEAEAPIVRRVFDLAAWLERGRSRVQADRGPVQRAGAITARLTPDANSHAQHALHVRCRPCAEEASRDCRARRSSERRACVAGVLDPLLFGGEVLSRNARHERRNAGVGVPALPSIRRVHSTMGPSEASTCSMTACACFAAARPAARLALANPEPTFGKPIMSPQSSLSPLEEALSFAAVAHTATLNGIRRPTHVTAEIYPQVVAHMAPKNPSSGGSGDEVSSRRSKAGQTQSIVQCRASLHQ